MHVAIRADGGPQIGYGHLVRTGALAERVLERGGTVTYATTTPEHVRTVCPTAVETVELPSRDEPEPFVEWLETEAPDVTFVDAYPVETDYQRAIRERTLLAVLQDDARHAVCADVFTNGNVYATNLEYEFVGAEPRLCLGPRYVLLRSDIVTLACRKPVSRATPERAIITMGGSDICDVTPNAIRAFDGSDIHVDAVVGPGFSETQARNVRTAASEVSATVSVVHDPEDLAERMFRADFALCTASSTTYELLALGTPFVCLPVADNQQLIARALRERDLAKVLDEQSVEAFRNAIDDYLTGHARRRELGQRGRELIDGRGTNRITAVLKETYER